MFHRQFATDDNWENAVVTTEPFVFQYLLIDPARARRIRRADYDLAGRITQRLADDLAQAGCGRQFVAVPEYGCEPLWNAAHRRFRSHQVFGYAVGL